MEPDESAVLADHGERGKGWNTALTDSDIHLEVVSTRYQNRGWPWLSKPIPVSTRGAFQLGPCTFECRLGSLKIELSAVSFHAP
jgi:hypothetical protein